MKATIDYFEIDSDIIDHTASNYNESGLYYNTRIFDLFMVDISKNMVWVLGNGAQFNAKNLFKTVEETPETEELKKEGIANAKLIAAAPELLKALDWERSLLRDIRSKNGWTQEEANMHERINKAIEKAI